MGKAFAPGAIVTAELAAPRRDDEHGEHDRPPAVQARRVLVCVGAAGIDTPALQVAAGLALGLRATLAGLYVEDDQLLRVAALPFTREFSFISARAHDFSTADLKRSQRVQAEQLRRMLAALADPLSLAWTLDIAQGELQAAAYAQAAASDLMVVCRPQFLPPQEGAKPAGTRRIHPAGLVRHPVAVLYDGSAAAERALHAALSLVRITGSELVVLIAAEDHGAFLRRKEGAQRLLGEVRARLHRVPAGDWPAALQAALTHGATALVRPRGNGYEAASAGATMLPAPRCSLVLIP